MADNETLIPLEDGPWNGLVDAKAPTARRVGKYRIGQNMSPFHGADGDRMEGRRGYIPLCAQLGGTAGEVQGLIPSNDQTSAILAVKGGEVYRIRTDGSGYTVFISTATLTGLAITLNAYNKVALTHFGQWIHVSDGTNTPFIFLDNVGPATVVKLVNSPVLYGQPVVKDSRLVGILASDHTTIVWSEVEDATTGYTTGGFTNAFKVSQTSQEGILQLAVEETYVIVQRTNSTTLISGGLTASYEATVNREGISGSSGTCAPFSGVWVDKDFYSVDQYLRPQLLRSGATKYISIGGPFAEEFRSIASPDQECRGLYLAHEGLVLFGQIYDRLDPDAPAYFRTAMLVIDVSGTEPEAVGVWYGFRHLTAMCVASATDAPARRFFSPRLIHGDGYGGVYIHGTWEDDKEGYTPLTVDTHIDGTTSTIDHVLETQALSDSVNRELIYDRLGITCRMLKQAYDFDVSVITPKGTTPVQTVTIPASVSANGLDDGGEEYHAEVGLDTRGRWARVRLRHHQDTSRFAPISLSLTGYVASNDPEIP